MGLKDWLDRMTNWQQFLLQGGAVGFSWLLTGLLMWAGWTLLTQELDDLRQQLHDARQERYDDHRHINDALNEIRDILKK